jgi:hypothetical protein
MENIEISKNSFIIKYLVFMNWFLNPGYSKYKFECNIKNHINDTCNLINSLIFETVGCLIRVILFSSVIATMIFAAVSVYPYILSLDFVYDMAFVIGFIVGTIFIFTVLAYFLSWNKKQKIYMMIKNKDFADFYNVNILTKEDEIGVDEIVYYEYKNDYGESICSVVYKEPSKIYQLYAMYKLKTCAKIIIKDD